MDFRNINKGNKSTNVKRSAARFLERQGFYIVLMVCLVIIGLTAFLALNGQQQEVPQAELPSAQEEQVNQSLDQPLANVSTPIAAAQPTAAAMPTPTASKPAATAEAITKVSAPVSGKIIFAFASDSLLYSTTLKQWTTHMGVDIAAAQGAEVKAVLSGTVEKVDKDDWLGNRITIKHDNNKKTVYCNLQDGISVKKGDVVTAGKVIGKVGNSATSECGDESHLHFEFYVNGKAVDPGKYVNFK